MRRRAAVAAGASADDAVPAPRVVGGYPATPGFDERAHLEAVISHGAPPIPILRRILLGRGVGQAGHDAGGVQRRARCAGQSDPSITAHAIRAPLLPLVASVT